MIRYKGDPCKIVARFNSTCQQCGKQIKKGESFYYWPNGKQAYCEKCGESEYNRFIESAMDEEIYNGRSW